MPFQPGNKYGGYRARAGRKPKGIVAIEERAEVLARQMLDDNWRRIMGTYLDLATKGNDSATTRHAVDKLIPDGFTQNQGKGFNVFIGINAKDAGPESAVRPDSLQIHLGGNNGQNGDGEDSA